jgi:hypothetical protein
VGDDSSLSSLRHFPWLPALLAAWAAFTGWCVWGGFPPCVDLAAHGAQFQTLVELLRGSPDVSQVYALHLPVGYGLQFWLFLPVAFLFNGAVAARLALWVALLLYPLSQLALLRAFRRPDAYVVLGLPLAFNISYWYGLVPGLSAQPLVFFALAAFARALEDGRSRWKVLLNLAALGAMLSHLLAFAVLCVLLGVWALCRRPLWPALRTMALGLVLPVGVSLGQVWGLATRAVSPGPWPATVYDAASHLNWFFRNYRPEGWLAAAAPLAVSLTFVGLYLRRRRQEPATPAALLCLSLWVLYLATPKTLSGIFLASVRLPVLLGTLVLLLVGAAGLPRRVYLALAVLSVASLAETARFHVRFAQAVAGLEEMIREPPPPHHGYVSLVGRKVLGSRHVYLDHLGQWWTATHGGVGHNFFADAEHHPVRFREGAALPADLWDFRPEDLERFDTLLVYGDAPLPAPLQGWTEVARVNAWRKLQCPATRCPSQKR